ncbi:MAG: FG-GAP repeat protein [Planctomycetes bacterium]|nr:FG-GAP repeat protein [Planctomycetota bacterium]
MITPSLLALATLLFTHPQGHAAGTTSPPAAGPAAAFAESTPKGLAASDWSSIRAAYEAGRHKIFTTENGWTARNPGHGLNTTFDQRGFTTKPDAGTWTWGLELQCYGWGATNPVTKPSATSTDGGRLSRAWDNRLTEWYVNDPRGLEHGFNVASRPTSANEPLTVDLSIRGGLRPVVSPDGRNVTFTDAQGSTALNYNGLTVFDAAGRTVSAKWYPIGGDRLRLQVEDSDANYPLTIDPVVQQAYLKASNTGAGDLFGYSVAISGDTIVVAAPGESSSAAGVNGNQADNSLGNSGAAYVFIRNGPIWMQQAYLKASNTGANDHFGWSVALSGDTVVVGADGEDGNANGVNGTQADNSAEDAGAAYVFVRSGTSWTQQAYLKASNTGKSDRFGWSVAISGDTVIVGAPQEESNATGVNGNQASNSASYAGAAYVFSRSGSSWIQQAYLKASNTESVDFFGFSVSVSGETVIVGAYGEDSNATGVNGNEADNSVTSAGAAYVFVRVNSSWSQQAYLKAANAGAGDAFGTSVCISGDTAVIGGPREDSSAAGVNGNGADNSSADSGAAYVFTRSGTAWNQQAYLKASNTGISDWFGSAVAISGDTIAVAAIAETSSATGINGNQTDNSAFSSGAAYVFARNGTVWTQKTYLKASNTGWVDLFGRSVAISGDIVVVGADGEDSNATGIDGSQLDNSASGAGAAYIFDIDNNPGVFVYGTGTHGCAGTHTLDVTHAPMINSPQFGITCNNAPPSTLGLGIFADVADISGSDPLFVGVLLHVDLFASSFLVPLDFVSDAVGSGVAAVPLPNAPSFIGNTYYIVALWVWTTCSLPPYNLSTSQGLAMTVLVP